MAVYLVCLGGVDVANISRANIRNIYPCEHTREGTFSRPDQSLMRKAWPGQTTNAGKKERKHLSSLHSWTTQNTASTHVGFDRRDMGELGMYVLLEEVWANLLEQEIMLGWGLGRDLGILS